MEDLFDFILQDCPVPNSQEEFLDGCGFERQDLQFEVEDSSASQLTPADPIIICSPPPTDSMECFQIPLENLPSQNPDEQDELRIDGVGDGVDGTGGVGSSAAVDLGRDTDLLLSESGKKKKILVGESSTSMLKSEIPDKDLDFGMSDAVVTVEVQDEFEANDSNGVTGVSQGAQRNDEGLGGIISGVSGLISGREDVIMEVAGSSSQDQEIGGEKNLARASGGSGRVPERNGSVEQTLPGVRSSVQGPEICCEAIQSAHVTGVANSSSSENSAQQYVKLSDLVSADDDDILVVAIKAGFKFPRPRWWKPEGYGRRASS